MSHQTPARGPRTDPLVRNDAHFEGGTLDGQTRPMFHEWIDRYTLIHTDETWEHRGDGHYRLIDQNEVTP